MEGGFNEYFYLFIALNVRIKDLQSVVGHNHVICFWPRLSLDLR